MNMKLIHTEANDVDAIKQMILKMFNLKEVRLICNIDENQCSDSHLILILQVAVINFQNETDILLIPYKVFESSVQQHKYLSYGPVYKIHSVKYAGILLDKSEYDHGYTYPKYYVRLSSMKKNINPHKEQEKQELQISYTAGYAAYDKSVPHAIKGSILNKVSNIYRNEWNEVVKYAAAI